MGLPFFLGALKIQLNSNHIADANKKVIKSIKVLRKHADILYRQSNQRVNMRYTVDVKEVWNRSFTVEANSKEEALEKTNRAIEAGEDDINFEFNYTLDTDLWTVFNLTLKEYEQ